MKTISLNPVRPTLAPTASPGNCRFAVGIMGAPATSGNRGVQALGAALARLCLQANPGKEVALFESHPDAGPVTMRPEGQPVSVNVVHWRMSPRSRLRNHLLIIVAGSFAYRYLTFRGLRKKLASGIPWIGALESTHVVGDVRGGDSFSDIYGLKRFLIATLPVLSVLWVKRDIVLFPQTYGPYKSRTARTIASWIVRHSSTVVARDKESLRVAQSLARRDQEILLSPDVAFALFSDHVSRVAVDHQPPALLPPGMIGLNVNGLMFNGGYTGNNMFGLKLDYRRFLHELATRLLAIHPGKLLLIPHTVAPAGDVESDNDASFQLKAGLPPALQSRVQVVTGDYDAHQLKGIIRQCEFFVGSRMHSCIAALSQGVPCAGVAYSMKFRGVFESVGMADWIVDGRSVPTSEAVDRVLELYHQSGQKRDSLLEEASAAKAQLHTIFTNLFSRLPA